MEAAKKALINKLIEYLGRDEVCAAQDMTKALETLAKAEHRFAQAEHTRAMIAPKMTTPPGWPYYVPPGDWKFTCTNKNE